ncbi:transposase family protein [Streptomyces sp. NPDC004549]|uniref:transposase family protein n=1 Tax=Streptomyces sp. NPDC004549 TaxID=3154283 RepID=UPI0033A65234
MPVPTRRGRPRILGVHQAVVATLILLRCNVSQATLADLLGVSQPTISRVFVRYTRLVQQALAAHVPPLPEVLRSRVVLLDGTLVPTGNRTGQQHLYSGKRHRAGVSVQVLASLDGRLLAVSGPVPGSTHDRAALHRTGWEDLLSHTPVIGDAAYRGTTVITPARKPPRGRLSPAGKHYNREFAALRAAVERAIAHLKNWKILATGYRNPLVDLPRIIQTVTALEFFRLNWTPYE